MISKLAIQSLRLLASELGYLLIAKADWNGHALAKLSNKATREKAPQKPAGAFTPVTPKTPADASITSPGPAPIRKKVTTKVMGEIAPRKQEFSWKGYGIEEKVASVEKKGGNVVFDTTGMHQKMFDSYWTAICNRAKKLSKNSDGTKRHRTHKLQTGDIQLEVTKAV